MELFRGLLPQMCPLPQTLREVKGGGPVYKSHLLSSDIAFESKIEIRKKKNEGLMKVPRPRIFNLTAD